MSIKQTAVFKGMARREMPVPHKAGDVQEIILTHTFTEDVNTTDVLELLALPAGLRITHFEYASENHSAVNVNIGFMSGTPGSTDAARTSGAELASAAALVSTGTPTGIIALAGIASSDAHRSIGLVPAANIVAGATKRIHLKVRYVRD